MLPSRRVLFVVAIAGAAAAGVVAFVAAGSETREVIAHGPRDARRLALTFDADMNPAMLARLRAGRGGSFDPEIIRVLRRTQTPATVFLTGMWVWAYPQVVRSLAGDPLFELENHSMDHGAFAEPCFGLPAVASDRKRWEVAAAAGVITDAAGVVPQFFRFPGGCYGDGDVELVRELGHEPVQWDVISGDSFERDPLKIARTVVEQAGPGSIVVMHLNGAPNAPATARALARIIPELRRRGFELVTLRELLGAVPPN